MSAFPTNNNPSQSTPNTNNNMVLNSNTEDSPSKQPQPQLNAPSIPIVPFGNSSQEISSTTDCVLPREFRNRLNKLFNQIEREYEREYRKLYAENLALQERLEKYEETEHDVKLNMKKAGTGYQISQRIKQQYKERTSRVLSRFHQSSFGVGSIGGSGGGFGHSTGNHQQQVSLQWMARFSGHRDGVWEVTAGRKNASKLLASSSADGTVRLWSTETGNILLIYLGHQNSSVNSVRLYQDLMLSAAGDGSAHLLRLSHYENLLSFENTSDQIIGGGGGSVQQKRHSTTGTTPTTTLGPSAASGTTPSSQVGCNKKEEITTSGIEFDDSSTACISSSNRSNLEQKLNCAFDFIGTDVDNSADDNFDGTAPLSMAPGLGQDVTLAARNCFIEENVAVVRHPLAVYQENTSEIAGGGYTFPLSSADFLPSVGHIVTASWDRIARIYDLNSGHLVTHLTGHDQGITDVRCFQQRVLTSAKDGTFRLWDFRKGGNHDVLVLHCHNQAVSTAQFVDDVGERLFTAGSSDRTCKLWDLRQTRSSVYSIRMDAPINRFAINFELGIVALPMDNRDIKLMEIATGNRIGRIVRSNAQTHQRMISSVTWAESIKSNFNLFSSSFDNQIFAWHATTSL